MMDQFGWGAEFLRVNEDVLDTYAACADGAEVVKAQVIVSRRRRYLPKNLVGWSSSPSKGGTWLLHMCTMERGANTRMMERANSVDDNFLVFGGSRAVLLVLAPGYFWGGAYHRTAGKIQPMFFVCTT